MMHIIDNVKELLYFWLRRRYSRSEKIKLIWFFAHLFVSLQTNVCEPAHARQLMQASLPSLNCSLANVLTKN